MAPQRALWRARGVRRMSTVVLPWYYRGTTVALPWRARVARLLRAEAHARRGRVRDAFRSQDPE